MSARLLDWIKQVKDPLLQGEVATPYYTKAMADLTEYATPYQPCSDNVKRDFATLTPVVLVLWHCVYCRFPACAGN
ncbi:MAG: hypothetical protein HN919_05620 [Verrucomicrobia bacterium]|nr:hypothetical protein [Verrucomicrobiota bacterium]MBT7065758.1 hypothetical protein [Verrucomicrobiota bacterium]MBT7701881.1 hypothetical protein [Verrucomicrobiota bacterium]